MHLLLTYNAVPFLRLYSSIAFAGSSLALRSPGFSWGFHLHIFSGSLVPVRKEPSGGWEGGLGWGIHVNPWLIHVNV